MKRQRTLFVIPFNSDWRSVWSLSVFHIRRQQFCRDVHSGVESLSLSDSFSFVRGYHEATTQATAPSPLPLCVLCHSREWAVFPPLIVVVVCWRQRHAPMAVSGLALASRHTGRAVQGKTHVYYESSSLNVFIFVFEDLDRDSYALSALVRDRRPFDPLWGNRRGTVSNLIVPVWTQIVNVKKTIVFIRRHEKGRKVCDEFSSRELLFLSF